MKTEQKYTRRTPEQIVADLEAKIAAVKNREVRKKAKANPCVKLTVGAVRLLDKALNATDDSVARRTIEDARQGLGAYVAAQGWIVPIAGATGTKAVKMAKRKRNNTAMSVAS